MTPATPTKAREYLVRLRTSDPLPIQRLKALLKSIGRRHGMRCLSVTEAKSSTPSEAIP